MNITIRTEIGKSSTGLEIKIPVTCSRKEFKQRYGKEALANTIQEKIYQEEKAMRGLPQMSGVGNNISHLQNRSVKRVYKNSYYTKSGILKHRYIYVPALAAKDTTTMKAGEQYKGIITHYTQA